MSRYEKLSGDRDSPDCRFKKTRHPGCIGRKSAGDGRGSKGADRAERLLSDGTPAKVVIFSGSIAGGEEAARCEQEFAAQHVTATLSVTPSWCYPLETIDLNPMTVKAIWGFNGTERPGAVYLASALAAHNQMKRPCFSIYGRDVQDMEEKEIPADVAEKILRFARCALVVGQMQNKAYVGFGAVSMGIMGSFLDPSFYIQYLGMRPSGGYDGNSAPYGSRASIIQRSFRRHLHG